MDTAAVDGEVDGEVASSPPLGGWVPLPDFGSNESGLFIECAMPKGKRDRTLKRRFGNNRFEMAGR